MTNLLEETIKDLKQHGLSPNDVLWCGSEEFGSFSWEVFKMLADKTYDSGYGGQEVAKDLLIVGKDWWMERYEYDGSESWDFKRYPLKPSDTNLTSVFARSCWETLKKINNPE